jgi:hypothetical protein
MRLSSSDKTTVLLKLLELQFNEILRRETREQQWFEWSTSLSLAAFAAIIALSGKLSSLPGFYSLFVKLLASILVALPTLLISSRILHQTKFNAKNAEAVEGIENLLRVFDGKYYGAHTAYPKDWKNQFTISTLKRKTPYYYITILITMATCVVIAIWLVL